MRCLSKFSFGETLAAKPTANIPMACDCWADMAAAYRFLSNDSVMWHGMMEPHWERTERCMSAHPVVLCLTDTLEFDFNGQQTRGLGPLNYEARRGMYVYLDLGCDAAARTIGRVRRVDVGAYLRGPAAGTDCIHDGVASWNRVPRLNEVLRLIAQLSGFIGRKSDAT